jgi:iron complex transport system ATP-binding protein
MSTIVVDQVSVVVGERKLLDRFSLRIEPGQYVALLGPNGAGKTTLLRCILGILRPTNGSVTLGGVESVKLSAKRRAAMVALLAQHMATDDNISVLDYVAAARFRHPESRRASELQAQVALDRVQAGALALRRLASLSGGERQRVALAALMAQDAAVMLLDEPANHLDPARQVQTYSLLGQLRSEGATALIVTHDVNLLAHLGASDQIRVVGMKLGQLAFELPFDSDRLSQALSELYEVPMRRISQDGCKYIGPTFSGQS